MRSAETREGRHHVDTVGRFDRPGEFCGLGGVVDESHVFEPLDSRAGDEDRALKRVLDGFARALEAHGGQQAVFAHDGLVAGVHEHERASAVGVLRVASVETGLTEQRGLLVPERARDGNLRSKEALRVRRSVQVSSDDGRTSGTMDSGTSNSSRSSSSQSMSWMLNNMVREAFDTSVTCAPVSL